MESLIPFIILACSIFLCVYILTLIGNKKAFWSSLTLAGINLLSGWLFAIYINFVLGTKGRLIFQKYS